MCFKILLLVNTIPVCIWQWVMFVFLRRLKTKPAGLFSGHNGILVLNVSFSQLRRQMPSLYTLILGQALSFWYVKEHPQMTLKEWLDWECVCKIEQRHLASELGSMWREEKCWSVAGWHPPVRHSELAGAWGNCLLLRARWWAQQWCLLTAFTGLEPYF